MTLQYHTFFLNSRTKSNPDNNSNNCKLNKNIYQGIIGKIGEFECDLIKTVKSLIPNKQENTMKKLLTLLLFVLALTACTTAAPEYTVLNSYGDTVEFRFGIKTGDTITLNDGEKITFASYFQPNIYFVTTDTNDFSDAEVSYNSETRLVTIKKTATDPEA